jgi:hypothetical protein
MKTKYILSLIIAACVVLLSFEFASTKAAKSKKHDSQKNDGFVLNDRNQF